MIGIFLGGHKLCNFFLRLEERKMGYFRGTIKKPKILDPSIGL